MNSISTNYSHKTTEEKNSLLDKDTEIGRIKIVIVFMIFWGIFSFLFKVILSDNRPLSAEDVSKYNLMFSNSNKKDFSFSIDQCFILSFFLNMCIFSFILYPK